MQLSREQSSSNQCNCQNNSQQATSNYHETPNSTLTTCECQNKGQKPAITRKSVSTTDQCDCKNQTQKPIQSRRPGQTSSSNKCNCHIPIPASNCCAGFPKTGTCVPIAAGFKSKQNIKSKLQRLAENFKSPDILTATFFEITRRYLNGEEASTPIEESIYQILDRLSPDILNISSCALNALDGLPTSQRNRLLSPEIGRTTNFTEENIAQLLAKQILQVAGQKLLDDPGALTNPRPGKIRRSNVSSAEFPAIAYPFIYSINSIRTHSGILNSDNHIPTNEETEKSCTINAQNQQVCTAQTNNCQGHSISDICLLVQNAIPGDLFVLQGANYYSTDAKVIIALKSNPAVSRVIPTIVFGDVDTPVHDEQGNLINFTKVKDKLLFSIPEDLNDGIYTIQVQVQNTNTQAGPIGIYTSDIEYLRILPPLILTFKS
ncbi:hypothetical protein [Paenibacillus albus]|uniref:Uncharacterized protein n=1 Tax=Paenibacillus albus TaxID=2495582 RepID=A0A3Q8X8Y5_9BACL|nr:hypothetical protein [Paenibacillus albus]AZN41536.1 hypothetical protein EJC50_19015 [Paenibacillus albus]